MPIIFLTMQHASCLLEHNNYWYYHLLVRWRANAIRVQSPQGGDGIVGGSAVGDRPWKTAWFEKSIIYDRGVLILLAEVGKGITTKGGMTS
jgi:hypothetical protein